jgi:flagellar biosynthesis protein FlhF
VTDGQKIPDDIGIAKRHDLVSRAVVIAQKSGEHDADQASGSSLFRAG